MHPFRSLAVVFLILGVVPAASAELIVRVTPDLFTVGNTIWTFSGSATVGTVNGGPFSFANGTPTGTAVWNDIGDPWSVFYNTAITPAVPAGATLTVSSGLTVVTRYIDQLYIDHDNPDPSSNDEFGVGVDGGGNVSFATGDTISWTGSFSLNQDIGNMNVGSYTSNRFGSTAGNSAAVPLRLIVSVPEPATNVLLLGLFAIGLAVHVRRRRITTSQN